MVKVRDVPKVKVVNTLQYYMQLAIDEMKKSISEHDNKPDPKVGAVLVKPNNKLEGLAFRGELRAGDHAEYTLIERKFRDKNLSGYTLYTTLEPCIDRNPPKQGCVFRIIDARISKVYIGHLDPDPTVSGKSVDILTEKGVEVEYFDREYEEIIRAENKKFFKEAEERAKVVHKNEILNPTGPLENELQNFDLRDFSEEAQLEFKESVGIKYKIDSDEYKRVLYQLGLIKISEQQGRKIIRATTNGLLLLGKNPEYELEQARVKFYIEIENSEPLTEEFGGPLVLLPDKIEKYLKVALPKAISTTNFKSKEVVDIPYSIMREVILNAIVHRDYTIQGAQIKVYIYLDRIEVHSPGIPIIALDKFKNFTAPSISRNHKIAFVFNQMNYIEELGRGMKIFSQMSSQYDLQHPEFSINEEYFIVSIKREKLSHFIASTVENLSDIEKRGYEYVNKEGKTTTPKYANKFQVDERTARRHLKKMVELELVETEGKARARVYKSKY